MSRRGLVLFSAMCVIWGIPYLFIKIAVRDLTPGTLVFGRTSLAVLLLLPLAWKRDEIRPLLARWRPVVLFAVVEIAIPWWLLASAETHLSSSLTALLIAAVPLIGAVVVRTTGSRDRLGWRAATGLAIGMGGVAALVGLDTSGAGAAGVLEAGAVAVCYAVGPIILARMLSDLPALGVISVSLALCALAYAPVAAIQHPHAVPGAEVLTAVAVLAAICTALAFLVFFALIAEIGPVRATVITYVNPAVAAVAGVAFLGESFTTGMGVGFVLVLLGSVLAARRGEPVPVDASLPLAEAAAD
ncbi:MAG TPA: DMT family transporter [Gaiellaceae bacterium]|nr:DMT family transporter [Gaiellaceae bacterium]